jgi:hypothetical protein
MFFKLFPVIQGINIISVIYKTLNTPYGCK